MLHLYLLRHGKAKSNAPSGGDYERELNRKGTAQTNQIGYILKQTNEGIEQILSSTAPRANQTTEIVNHYLRLSDIKKSKELYLANVDTMNNFIRENATANKVLYVGHNFGISDITEYYTGELTSMSTSQLIHIEFDVDSWDLIGNGNGRFVKTILPDVLAFS